VFNLWTVSFELALILAIFIIIVAIFAVGAMYGSRRQREKEEELQRAASARGWKFESVSEKGYRVHRWTGTTEGIPWTAESLRLAAGGNKRHRRRHIARWHGSWRPGINAAIAIMGVPKGKEAVATTAGDGEGFFVKLAQKAAGFAFDKAIDVYFGHGPGEQVDAATMRRVDGQNLPGFIVMAIDQDEGTRILAQGLERALVDASNDKSSVFSEEDRPWLLLQPDAIRLARMEMFRDIKELEGFIRAGVGLTHAFKFGHR
jgi:hypothetical protein